MRLTIILLSFLLLPFAATAQQDELQEGVQFHAIEPAQPGAEDGRVRVNEFFLYSCPHCHELEPLISEWIERQPDYVEFARIPAVFSRPDTRIHAEAFYALDLMGKLEELHPVIFAAIHEEGLKLRTEESVERLLAEHGVDLDEFRKARESFAVQTSVRRAAVLADRYGISGVPALVIDGRYRTSPADARGYAQALAVTDALVQKVRAAKQD
ncbi:MAG: thiol:disulfide interchange protein DsbA/DsbL [Chromatiales bacterium]|jgi:thiol:disulfide interchange protein DsbA